MERHLVKIQSLSEKGEGRGYIQGKPFTLRGVFPGDVVEVEKKKRRVRFVSLREKSPERVEPRCPHTEDCGGCTLQELSYSAQLRFKEEKVLSCFSKLDLEKVWRPIVPSPEVFGYRNKMEFTFSRKRWIPRKEAKREGEVEKGPALGLHAPGRFDKVVDLKECHLISPRLQTVFQKAKSFLLSSRASIYSTRDHEGFLRFLILREGKNTGDLLVNLVTRTRKKEFMARFADYLASLGVTSVVNGVTSRLAQVSTAESLFVDFGKEYLEEQLGEFRFFISPYAFFQVNTKMAEKLFQTLVEWGDWKSTDRVVDCYAGSGTISIYLSPLVKEVVGLEVLPEAVSDARRNAERNRVLNCQFRVCDLAKEELNLFGFEAAVLDPPRAGVHPRLLRRIGKSRGIRRVLYVSCNPKTMAEDIWGFLAYDFQVHWLCPFDMFPHTPHVECAALLVR